jgi:polar amino acid transport system substrate-binding protein
MNRKKDTQIRIRAWGAVVLVTVVGLTAACSSSKGRGASQSVQVPRAGQGIGPGALPKAPAAPPKQCGKEATAASWNGPLPGPNDPLPAGGTVDQIRNHKKHLTVGIDLNTELFGYDPKHDNVPQGFDVDIARAMARAIFGDADPSHIQFRVVPLADPKTGEYAQLNAGYVDLVVETTTITCGRMQGSMPMRFSNPYYTAQLKLLMPRGDDGKPQSASLESLKGKNVKVCATLNSTSAAEIKQVLGEADTVSAPNALDCLAYLQQGEVGAIFTDDAILRGMESQDPHVAMTTAAPEEEQPYGIVTRYVPKSPTDPTNTNDLTAFVNTALANLMADPGPNGWSSLFAKDLGSQPASLPAIPEKYPLGG